MIYNVTKSVFISDSIYDSYEYYSSRYIFLSSKGKKGVWTWKNNTPDLLFDDIVVESVRVKNPESGNDYTTTFAKFKRGKHYGLVEIEDIKNEIVPFKYDDILYNESFYYTTVKKKLQGAANSRWDIDIAPKYKSIKQFARIDLKQNKVFYFLFEAIDKDGKRVILDKHGKEFRG